MGDALRRRIRQERFESPVQEAMLNLMVAAEHLRERMDRLCAEFDLSPSQYNVLRILRGAPEGHPRCEIARRMIDRAPDVTRLVDRLERRGLVERDRSAADRRLSLTRITPAGLALLERMRPRLDEEHRHLAERISHADQRELSRLCEQIYDGEGAEAAASSR
jgi:DNA-binding MarR family transcriptional regulator